MPYKPCQQSEKEKFRRGCPFEEVLTGRLQRPQIQSGERFTQLPIAGPGSD